MDFNELEQGVIPDGPIRLPFGKYEQAKKLATFNDVKKALDSINKFKRSMISVYEASNITIKAISNVNAISIKIHRSKGNF